MAKRFYQITQSDRTADINIYGNISSAKKDYWTGSDNVTSKGIKEEIDSMDVDSINVYINSYGGEVAEALAIYSALKRHKASVHTYVDGFACSAATIIFCAGDERTMGPISLMMIHNCMVAAGYANAVELRKLADDAEKINQSSVEAYKAVSNLSEDKIHELMDAETWISAQEALEWGFATDIAEDDEEEGAQQSAFGSIREAILSRRDRAHSDTDRIIEAIDALAAIIKQEGDPEDLDDPKQTDDPEENQEPEEDPVPEKHTTKQKAARFFGCF